MERNHLYINFDNVIVLQMIGIGSTVD
jgi:hypothetical protein